jgi:hypothetical protein
MHMPTSEELLSDIESADTPLAAVEAAGQLSVREVIRFPFQLAGNIGKIIMHGDTGAMFSEALGRHF